MMTNTMNISPILPSISIMPKIINPVILFFMESTVPIMDKTDPMKRSTMKHMSEDVIKNVYIAPLLSGTSKKHATIKNTTPKERHLMV